MLYMLAAAATPLLLIFGLYHLLTWIDLFHISERPHWKRVGLTAALAHFLLVTGFLAYSFSDYQANERFVQGMDFGPYLINHTEFRHLLAIFDTVPMAVLLGLFTLMDRVSFSGDNILPVTVAVTYLFGTLQWYFVGGAAGALLERFWDGLKTGEDGEEWFQ
jgi:hypothetical protein